MQHGTRAVAVVVAGTLLTGCPRDVGPSWTVKSPRGYMALGVFVGIMGLLVTGAAINPGDPPPGEEPKDPGERVLLGSFGIVLTGLGVLSFRHGWTK